MNALCAVAPTHLAAPAHHVIPANAGISGAALRRMEIPGQARDDEQQARDDERQGRKEADR